MKGPSVNRDPPQFGLNVVTKESADIQAAREFQASLGSSSKQSKTHAKGAKGSVHGSQSSQSLTEERSEKPLAKPPRQGYMTLNEHHHSSLIFDSPLTQVELASPETFMAIARVRASVPRTAEQPAQQRSTATVQSSTSTIVRPVEAPAPKVKISLPTATQQTTSGKVAVTSPDKVQISLPPRENQIVASTLPIANANLTKANEQPLPDVLRPQSPQQPSIPVLDPMGHLRALEASGLLSKELTDMLNNAIRTSFHAQAATKPTTDSSPKIKTSNDAVVLNEPSRPATYTQTELKALRPKAESNSPPNVSFTAPQTSDTTQEAKKLTNPFAARTVPLQSTGPAENSRGLAQRLADQRKALIGEHIHRTRFQPPVQFLIEGFKKLSLHDYTNTESATEISDTTSTKRAKTTENPFGSPKPRGSGPELPYHLRNMVPAADHGAAVRRQYGIPDFTTPASKTQTNTIAVPKTSETSPQPHRRSQAVAKTSPTARPPASNKPKPSLPAFLRGQTAGDAGAAARAQYGGKTLAPFMSNATPSLTVSNGDNSAKSRPQLPAHLRGQTAGDPGAAVRAQYSNVPAPVTNSLKASSTVPRQEPLSPTKPRRGSKVNTSGFIGLAQAARNSIEEEDDPIKIASSKGY